MKLVFRILGAAVLVLALTGPASATTINYTLTNLGNDTYRYDYAVTDWDPGSNALCIYFPTVVSFVWDQYSAVSVTIPGGWGVWTYLQDPASDVEYLVPRSTTSASLAVTFLYTGTLALGDQEFEVYNALDGQPAVLTESGVTADQPVPGGLPARLAAVAAAP